MTAEAAELTLSEFTHHELDDGCSFYVGRLPEDLLWDGVLFDEVWDLQPADRHHVRIRGNWIELPRGQQAYGADYRYTGSQNNARPVPRQLLPILRWSQETVDSRLQGILLNWYSGPDEYIGPHHDSPIGLVPGSPIVTVSFGETRLFRLQQNRDGRSLRRDFPATPGTVFVTPWETNRRWKHSVPKRKRYTGRRISVTLRAFSTGVLPPERYLERDL